MANSENKNTFRNYIFGNLFGGRKKRGLSLLVTAFFIGHLFQLAPLPTSSWYSVKTHHNAVVTNKWTGNREVKEPGNHMKNLWAIPGINAAFTSVDEHLLTEHIWFFRNSFKNNNSPTVIYNNSNRQVDKTLENYVDVSSADLKQTLVKVGIKYKINDLEKFAMTRMGGGLDRINEHDRPYFLTGDEFDTHIFSAVQSKDQATLLRSTSLDGGKEVQEEIRTKINKSDLEERYGIEVTSVVYDARLVPEVAQANTEKQRQILLGEGFRDRTKSDAEAWHELFYTGYLNIKKGDENYNKSFVDLLKDTPENLRSSLIEGYNLFSRDIVLKDRDGKGDTLMIVPDGSRYVLPSPAIKSGK